MRRGRTSRGALPDFVDLPRADYGDAIRLLEMARRVLADAPQRFALAGHSMGARGPRRSVASAPRRVTRLALLDTGYAGAADGCRR